MGRSGAPGITSPVKVVANVFVSFIGAGMLGLPFAYKESGIMEGALIMAVVGYLSVSAMLMLIDCKYAILSSGGRAGGRSIIMDTKGVRRRASFTTLHHTPPPVQSPHLWVPLIPPDSSDDEDEDERHPPTPSTDLTYGDVGLYALGAGGKRLVDIAIVVSQLGFCCGYLIYLCKNLNAYVPQVPQRVWLLFLLPPLYCLTLLRHLNKLAVFSLFAQVSNVLALTVVFWFDFSHSEEVPFTPKEFSIKGFPFFFAVAIYCYEGAGMILSLEESMAEKEREKFRPIFICTMAGLTTLYICFGVSGYASFGPHTKDIITLNLPHGQGSLIDFAAIVKICLGVSLFFTYPMMLFPVTHLMDKTLGLTATPYKGNMLRLVLVALTGIVASAVPNFAVLMSLIGATCCTLLAFILPASFHLSIFKQRLTKRQRYFDIMLIVLGVLGSVVGLWDAFNRMSQAHDPQLDVNEFSSHKNGSTHPPRPPLDANHPPQTTVDSVVQANLSAAEKKYGQREGQMSPPDTQTTQKPPHIPENLPSQPPTQLAQKPPMQSSSSTGEEHAQGAPRTAAGAVPGKVPKEVLPASAKTALSTSEKLPLASEKVLKTPQPASKVLKQVPSTSQNTPKAVPPSPVASGSTQPPIT